MRAQVLLALFSIDDITGFKITQVLELPQPAGILVTWGAVLPLVFLIASALTNLVFKDGVILNVSCMHEPAWSKAGQAGATQGLFCMRFMDPASGPLHQTRTALG